MAKNQPKVVAQKAPRVKSPAQKARSVENAIAALVRLAALQAAQKAGFRSVDEQMTAVAEEAAAKWLASVFAVRGHGQSIRRWLASRIDRPAVEVRQLVSSFLARPNNATMAHEVALEGFAGFKEELAA